jgi:hypothetical protein
MANKLNIRIPRVWLQADEWTDREKVFLGFLYLLIKKHGWSTKYYIHFNDIRIMCGYDNVGNRSFTLKFDKLRKILRIGFLNEYTTTVYPLEHNQRLGRLGLPAAETEVLNDMNSIQIWFYLMGRFADKNLIVDHEEGKEIVWGHKTYYALDYNLRKELKIMRK